MKVAHLYRYPLKQAEDTGFSVQDNGLDPVPLGVDLPHQITIDFFSLGFDEIVGDGFFIYCIFGNDQSEFIGAFSEKGGVDHCRDAAGFSVGDIRDKGMNLLLDPLTAMTVFISQLLQGEAVGEIVLEDRLLKTLRSPFRGEASAAMETDISLNSLPSPVLLDRAVFTIGAPFLQAICKKVLFRAHNILVYLGF